MNSPPKTPPFIANSKLPRGEERFSPIVSGAIAGLVATGPMTMLLLELERRLPRSEQSPLPPAIISRELILSKSNPGPDALQAGVAMASHFAFGSVGGGLYSLTAGKMSGSPVLRGAMFGGAFWALNYLVVAPLLGMRADAFQMPKKRNGMMFLSHILWGAIVGYCENLLNREGAKFLAGAHQAPEAE